MHPAPRARHCTLHLTPGTLRLHMHWHAFMHTCTETPALVYAHSHCCTGTGTCIVADLSALEWLGMQWDAQECKYARAHAIPWARADVFSWVHECLAQTSAH
eukprot:2118959-Alexandrium_andersonii.AAC.1